MKKKYLFIINPKSGTSNTKSLDYESLAGIRERGNDYELVYTEYAGHATEIALQAVKEGVDYVIAIGGDGTVNEIAQTLVGTNSALGIIPSGSGNGLARHLKIPLDHQKAVKLLLEEKIKVIDACYMNQQAFFCTSGLGFDALVSQRFDESPTRGLLSYAKISMREYFNYKGRELTLEIDGKKQKIKAFMVTFANAGQYGNDFYISPKADISDGLIDVCIVKQFPKLLFFELLFHFIFKTTHKSNFVNIIRGKKVKVQFDTSKEYLHLDGEPGEVKQAAEYSIKAQSLKVLV